jgi:GntR family transcriptional regulator
MSGRYAPGNRLPSENDLVRDYDVAKETARRALAQIVAWGLAAARRGAGVYVRDFRPIIRDGISRLGADTWPAGQSIWSAEAEGRSLGVDQLEVGEADAPTLISVMLGLGAGDRVVYRSRLFVLDGKPVLLARSWLPSRIAAGTPIMERDTGPGGTYARLAELGHAPVLFREDLRARMPSQAEIERLSLPAGTPVVEIVRTARDASRVPVEVNEMIADSGAYVFRYEFGD